jgi:hypothetical protein
MSSNGVFLKCPDGFRLDASSYVDPYDNKFVECRTPGVAVEEQSVYTLECPSDLTLNSSYNDPDNMQVLCSNMPPSGGEGSAPFTNVNRFKSRKERNIEKFSQNTNGKCKARY